MVRITEAMDKPFVPVVVSALPAPVSSAHQPKGDVISFRQRRDCQDAFGPVADLCLLAQVDLTDDGADKSVGQLTVAGGAGPVEAGPQVGPQLAEPPNPFGLRRADQQLVNAGHLMQTPLRVPAGDQDRVVTKRQLLGGELPNRFQQPETPTKPTRLDQQHRPFDQFAQQVIDSRQTCNIGECRSFFGNPCGGCNVERPGEDGQPPNKDLLSCSEEVIGPPDGGAQRPVACRAGPTATGQQVKAITEAGHEVRWAQGSAASRGQLDGQWDAIQAAAASNVGQTARARSLKSSAAGPAGSRGATGRSCSSPMPRASLEVASTRTIGQPWAMAVASSDAPLMTCSQLSRTSSVGRDCSPATTDPSRVRPGCSLSSRAST